VRIFRAKQKLKEVLSDLEQFWLKKGTPKYMKYFVTFSVLVRNEGRNETQT
jgi:hypothetical protein